MNNVFGLDIGTRNVVGTVGYRTSDDRFTVIAQNIREHDTRAMLDGQIHDIGRVARTIQSVKEELERQTGEELTDVCIAAAGRVLKTITTHVEITYPEENLVTGEDVNTLHLLGVEKAQEELREKNDTRYKFYCVGYSVVRYYLNGDFFQSLEGHKAFEIGVDIIVTFLPEDVVDGLYSAVGQAGLGVANMTLEPIAAINIAIPEHFRMLNIALVDVGAGTSDISVTKDGSITAYGMIPYAGDELTEVIVQHYLVDFKTAERMKVLSTTGEDVTYEDIMCIPHTIPAEEIWELVAPVVDKIAAEVAEKIRELNGNKSVSACFVVGGGGKIHGFTEMLSDHLGLPQERVALRGEEVLRTVTFQQEDIRKDPLLVTPIGICMNYYEQKNSFIMARFNGERVKLYDNNHLTIADAALAADFPNGDIFPKRGEAINYTVNGIARIARGEAGEPAVVTLNGEPANINTPIEANAEIAITPSTCGVDAAITIGELEDFNRTNLLFVVNGVTIRCPQCVQVNGQLQNAAYEIKDGDAVEARNYYTVEELLTYMDYKPEQISNLMVNNRAAELDTLVYDNFTVEWKYEEAAIGAQSSADEYVYDSEDANAGENDSENDSLSEATLSGSRSMTDDQPYRTPFVPPTQSAAPPEPLTTEVTVIVNNEPVHLTGKREYVFVDIFDKITFDLKAGGGRAIATLINGREAQFNEKLSNGDHIEVYWKEKF